jgi:dTDP-4-amino-4,6-dideoxygalactose transaminase
MKSIPFSPPFIDEDVYAEVKESLSSGWITSGPKVKALEEAVEKYTGAAACICVNSWTSGALLMLKWFGVGPGDEVIVPAYTYSATALTVLHCGATPVLVDVKDDFTIDPKKIAQVITEKTKVIMPVDIGGWLADYDSIKALVANKKHLFKPATDVQKKLGRILVLADAAHSFGSIYKGRHFNFDADIVIYSFHAVKNLTTAEGGAICINLPEVFEVQETKKYLKIFSLNGQTKDAFTKSQSGPGAWKYDIIALGHKVNMPDVCAAIGLAQLKKYDQLQQERKRVFEYYLKYFSDKKWAINPPYTGENQTSSCHLYMLIIKGIAENQRDKIMDEISKTGVSVNVHFIPLPMLTLFKKMGFDIENFPKAYDNYSREISLPVYPQLSDSDLEYICHSVSDAVEKELTLGKTSF